MDPQLDGLLIALALTAVAIVTGIILGKEAASPRKTRRGKEW